MSRTSPRIFRVSDGYRVNDFLHYGFDNLSAAELLFNTNARYFDSAGYLVHLGIELILKAWHLYAFEQFEEGHHLPKLWETLQQDDKQLHLDDESTQVLSTLDEYFTLRYPNPPMPLEIGSDDLPRVLKLQRDICSQMPKEMHEILGALSAVSKGGRTLMEKPIGS